MLFRKKRKSVLDFRWDKPISYYADMFINCGGTKDIGVSLYIDNHFITQISFEISQAHKQKTSNCIHIHNLRTDPKYRNMGFGKQLLLHIASNVRKINKYTGYDTISISGTLDIRDLPYWKFSLPMYYSFSREIIGPKVVCLLNNEPVEKENLVSAAYNINSQNIAVNFEFTTKKCFLKNKKSPLKKQCH